MTGADELAAAPPMGWIFNHLPSILWQRRLYVITTFVLFAVAATVAAFTLPTLYRSSAVLTVESQSLPKEMAAPSDVDPIEQRIGKIRERVLSRGDLISLIQQNNLYPDMLRSKPISAVVDHMREETTISAMNNDVVKSGGQDGVIAISMSFDYPEPSKAQTVLQSYVTSFLRIDSESVADQAALTLRFLTDQASTLQQQISQIETQITQLKARNGAALAAPSGASMIDTGSYSAQIVSLENSNRQLAIESRKSPGGSNPVADAEAALAAARSMYSDSHPDVARARARLDAARQAAASTSSAPLNDTFAEQIKANNDAIANLRAARDAAVARANSVMAGQARAPAIEEQAMQLESRASGLRDQLKSVSEDLLKARANVRMSEEQRGERLSLVDPPNLPDEPASPNRPLLIAAGCAAGLVLGLLLAMMVEFIRRPVRSPVQIESLGLPILGVVPILKQLAPPRRFQFFRKAKSGA